MGLCERKVPFSFSPHNLFPSFFGERYGDDSHTISIHGRDDPMVVVKHHPSSLDRGRGALVLVLYLARGIDSDLILAFVLDLAIAFVLNLALALISELALVLGY